MTALENGFKKYSSFLLLPTLANQNTFVSFSLSLTRRLCVCVCVQWEKRWKIYWIYAKMQFRLNDDVWFLSCRPQCKLIFRCECNFTMQIDRFYGIKCKQSTNKQNCLMQFWFAFKHIIIIDVQWMLQICGWLWLSDVF